MPKRRASPQRRWWIAAAAAVVAWQAWQGLALNVLGLPGLWTLPLERSDRPGAAPLPAASELRGWVRARAHEFVGGVDAKGMPLYRFEVWVEAPASVRTRLKSVSYVFQAPSAAPAKQTSDDTRGRFLVTFSGASCARVIKTTFIFDDGRSRNVEVDGCAILV